MLTAFFVSFGIIFAAEMGDKSQLMALAFATRYKALPTLIGITIATGVVHLLSVALGAGLGAALPQRPMNIVAGLAFVVFGLWTLRGDQLTEEDRKRTEVSNNHAIWAVGSVFFLAELGDKTMLATVTLATDHGVVGTWIGSTVGMVAADAIAIVVGRMLGARLPERAIKIGATVTFFVFAALLIYEGISG